MVKISLWDSKRAPCSNWEVLLIARCAHLPFWEAKKESKLAGLHNLPLPFSVKDKTRSPTALNGKQRINPCQFSHCLLIEAFLLKT